MRIIIECIKFIVGILCEEEKRKEYEYLYIVGVEVD